LIGAMQPTAPRITRQAWITREMRDLIQLVKMGFR
jgi:hypothetical protein